MKRNLILGLLVVGGLCFISSCKDDEVPIAGISFELAEQEVTESDGTPESFHPEIEDNTEERIVPVKLVFDRPLAGDVVLKFDLDGDARAEANSEEYNDFELLEESDMVTIDGDEITILKGATEASFDIVVYEDLLFEYSEDHELNADGVPFETVILELESVVSGPGKLGTQLEHTLKILEDDAVAALLWEAQDMTPEEALVDMDILFWVNNGLSWGGAAEGSTFEVVNIPAGLGEGDFGVSYTYYSGNSDDLLFRAEYYTTAGTFDGTMYTFPESDPLPFEGAYKLINKNAWGQSSPPKIAQTMIKSGINYSDISAVQAFDTGSRIGKTFIKPDRALFYKLAELSRMYSRNGFMKK